MRIAVVTGASSGMGREFVRQIEHLYKELDEIWVIARRRERLEELRSRMLTNVRIFQGDLLKDEIYQDILQALEEKTPNIRMLVNAAGVGKKGEVKELSCDSQLEMIDLNCKSLTRITKICIPYMKKGSRIINMASAAAFCPQPSFSVYASTKAYVLSFSRSLGKELEKEDIYVTAVCPGPVETEFLEIAGKTDNPIKDAAMVQPEAVVKKALVDAKNKKDVSVYGVTMKATKVATKLLPHRILIDAMDKLW